MEPLLVGLRRKQWRGDPSNPSRAASDENTYGAGVPPVAELCCSMVSSILKSTTPRIDSTDSTDNRLAS